MATTTNYGWTTPDDTALVKDGAAAIRTLGSSVDTTTKNLNPETTLGDIAYRSSTANVNTRLGLGTAGQILAVNSGATAPEWVAAPVSGGLTLINTGGTALTGSSVTIGSIPQTYVNLKLIIQGGYNSANADAQLRFNNNSTASNYNWFYFRVNNAGTVIGSSQVASSMNFGLIGTASTWIDVFMGEVDIYRYSQTENKEILWSSKSAYSGDDYFHTGTCQFLETTAISSITIRPDSGTFSGGTAYLYGVK